MEGHFPMPGLTRSHILHVLQHDWADYADRFHCLAPEAQAAFLKKQGYACFADLLAHITSWWEVGHHAIENYLKDAQYAPPEYDVDRFNAEAVAKARGQDEVTILRTFQAKRLFLIEWVSNLPESSFENEKVTRQFNMELIGHLTDHQIP
jgi:hypothetical protein